MIDRPAVLAPSILASDFSRLGEEIAAIERGGAGVIHIDTMDGRFVPNLSFGVPIVEAARKVTDLPLDCHLMVENPDHYIDPFIKAGADVVTVHWEAATHLHRTLTRIRELGARAGVALNPATPLSHLEDILPFADLVLVMSVNPGFGGQKFIPQALDRIRRLRQICADRGLDPVLEIDGGVDQTNLAAVVEAGAEWIVAGSAVFGGGTPEAATREMVESL